MPELPEVEASRRLIENALIGKVIVQVETRSDEIVYRGEPEPLVQETLQGQRLVKTGRKGKFFWLQPESGPVVLAHLGMSGAILDLTPGSERALHYKEVKGIRLDDGTGFPPYLKLWIRAEDGSTVAMVDPRRLARIWRADEVAADPQVRKLGPDALLELPAVPEFGPAVLRRKTPIKALLLNQSFISGIGNWIADEVLYHAGIAPARLANSLSAGEIASLHQSIAKILRHAVDVDADYHRFPPDWMFHHRWGGGKGAEVIDGETIVRETIGGRTTAWVPSRQR